MADANNTRDAYENLDRIVPGLWGTLIPIGVIGNGFVLYIILRLVFSPFRCFLPKFVGKQVVVCLYL